MYHQWNHGWETYQGYILNRELDMPMLIGILLGLTAWFLLRVLLMGVYTVDQNERAVKTRFGRALRVAGEKTTLDDPIAEALRPEERARYAYPQVRVIQPGGP